MGAVQHAAAMRARRCGRCGARRGDAGVESGSSMDAGTTAIQEEGESDDFFYFHFRADDMIVLAVGLFRGRRGPPTCVPTKWTSYRRHFRSSSRGGWSLDTIKKMVAL